MVSYNSSNPDFDYGYIYCMTNKYMPNLCKIGFVNTINKTSHDRAKELSSNTSCPIEFEVIFDIKVKNPQKYEKRIHKKLNHLRINLRREFFQAKPEDIITFFYKDNLIKYNDENDDFPDSYLTYYNTFKKDNKIINKDRYIFVSFTELFMNIYNVLIIVFRLFLSIVYYFYIILSCIKNVLFNKK